MTDTCVVVPTVREYECVRAYVANAREHGHDDRLFFLLVTEEFCDTDAMAAMLDDLGVAGAVFDGPAREAWYAEQGIAEYGHVVPAASHAETSFGLLYLWAGDFEYGVFLDDDTLPHDVDFFGTHYRNLAHDGPVTEVRSDEHWVNVLYQNADEHGLYPRGYPYAAMDETVEECEVHLDRGDVVVSQGLWTNVPDLDAVRILADGDLRGQARTRTTAVDYDGDFVAAPGHYLTVCSMNLAFRREVVPAFYQLPMDDNEWDVGRFDDIWSGVFLKRACDLLGKRIYSGAPLCEHNKAPRPTFDDLANEAPALELNEHVWEIVDSVVPEAPRAAGAGGTPPGVASGPGGGRAPPRAARTVEPSEDSVNPTDSRAARAATPREDSVVPEGSASATSYADAYAAMADALAEGTFDEWTNGAFLNHVGEHMRDWLSALDALEAGDGPVVPGEASVGASDGVAHAGTEATGRADVADATDDD